MTNHTKLKLAAETVKQAYADLCEHGGDDLAEAWNTAELAYDDAANPDVVLALIAENERIQEAHEQICTNYNQVSYASEERGKQIDQLKAENAELGRYLCTCRDCGGEGSLHTGDWHSCSPMEPPEPVMEKCGECDGTGLIGEIQDLYQVITERDQLRAEVAGLRTGYEAYERVNAELKAENEALRKDAERLQVSTAFVQKLCDSAGKQPSVATGYLHDILAALGQGEQS